MSNIIYLEPRPVTRVVQVVTPAPPTILITNKGLPGAPGPPGDITRGELKQLAASQAVAMAIALG